MSLKEKANKLPDAPGVYFFWLDKKVLYVGKATSLRDRVKSYFRDDVIITRGPKVAKLVHVANDITYEQTDSVLEALILESKHIKKLQPEFNTRDKDDKSYNYLVITKEEFPRVVLVRGLELERGTKVKDKDIDEVFGPFPHGNQLRTALKLIRKIFPFRDYRSKVQHHDRFYSQLGLTPDTSTEAAKDAYKTTIKHIKLFLRGEKKRLVTSLETKMKELAKDLKFEQAQKVKESLFALQHIHDVALIKDDMVESNGKIMRMEAYDIAHTSGKDTVGVMTVVTNGETNPGQYRKFKIRSNTNGSDTDALRELLRRRFTHDEWRFPNVIVIDGGLAQKRLAEKVVHHEYGLMIPIVSVVKNDKHKPEKILGQQKYVTKFEKSILLVNHEAHRFAIEYHRKLRGKIA